MSVFFTAAYAPIIFTDPIEEWQGSTIGCVLSASIARSLFDGSRMAMCTRLSARVLLLLQLGYFMHVSLVLRADLCRQASIDSGLGSLIGHHRLYLQGRRRRDIIND